MQVHIIKFKSLASFWKKNISIFTIFEVTEFNIGYIQPTCIYYELYINEIIVYPNFVT